MDDFVVFGGMVSEYIPELVGAAFNFLRPPSSHVIDGRVGFLRRLGYRNGSGVILIVHDPLSLK